MLGRICVSFLLLVVLVGCVADTDDTVGDGGTPPGGASSGSGDSSGDDGPDETGGDSGDGDGDSSSEQLPPTIAADLEVWLDAGRYLEWAAESAVHASAGPHFGDVRTFLNDAAFASLAAGNAVHPVGAALVKELYGRNNTLNGYAVMVKVADGLGGVTWYWYEGFGSSVFADGVGDGTCTGCHSASEFDFVLTPFPLQ